MVHHAQVKILFTCNNARIQAQKNKSQYKSCKRNFKRLQQQNICVLKSQIIKSDLKSHNLKLNLTKYPKTHSHLNLLEIKKPNN